MKNLVFILLLSFSFTQDGCTDELACNYDENEDCNYVCYNIDNSLSFDGTNAHVEIPHDNHLNLENEGFTIFTKVMFKAFEDQRRHQILTKSEGAGWHKKWIFGLPNINSGGQGQGGTTNSLVFHAGDEGQRFYARSNEFTPELYKWYDIAVASENGNYTFYIDGDYWGLDSGDGGFADIVSNSADLLIGAKEPNEAWDLHSLDGNIDELLIWNTCLTAEQIFDISHNGNSYDFEPDNIVANWQFNQHNSELNNEYLVDESGNKLHGILNGPEWNVLGCTDQSYGCNYDSESTLDDGSCDYSCHDNGDYSLNFDGQNHVELPFQNNILSTGEFNVRVNFNSINLDAEHVGIYSLGDEPFDGNSKVLLGLHRWVNDNIRFGIYSGTWHWVDSGISPSLNTWYNITCSWGPEGMKIYIDGALKDTNSFYEGLPAYANHYIGAGNQENGGFEGMIDNLIISSNNEELAYYKFNQDGDGEYFQTLIDFSGNQNHGNIYGAEWVQNTTLGDLNSDTNIDILDIIILVNIIAFSGEYNELGDINGDGTLNILDAVALVQIVLAN